MLRDCLFCRKEPVVLNRQHSFWDVIAGVPQGSFLGPLLLLIYINDLPNDLSSNCELFPDDTSLFSVVNNIGVSATTLSQDFKLGKNQLGFPIENDF